MSEKWGLSHRNPEKLGHSYTFCWKKRGQSYTWQRWKRGLFGTHIRTMPYIGSYPPPPPEVMVEGECFYFFCLFTFIRFPLSPLSPSFISSTISSISLLPFSGRRHKSDPHGLTCRKSPTQSFNSKAVFCLNPNNYKKRDNGIHRQYHFSYMVQK